MKKIPLPKKYIAWAIGFGLALFAVHNIHQPLIEYIFLPVVGLCIVIVCCAFMLNNPPFPGLGSKWIWIPMLVIVGSLWARLIVDFSMETVAGGCMGLVFFAVYLTARTLGKDILEAFLPLVIIEALSVIWLGLAYQGFRNGGIISHSGNYDIAAGFLLLGLVFSAVRHQWWLSGLVIVALFFTGAEEAMFACAVLLVVILIRQDWSKKLLVPVIALAITVAIFTPLGVSQQLFFQTATKVAMAKESVESTEAARVVGKIIPEPIKKALVTRINEVEEIVETETNPDPLDSATGWRYRDIQKTFREIKPLGRGLNLTNFYEEIPHNVPVIIMHQIGIAGAIAWLVIMVWCLIKTKWKYAFVMVLALSVFDHFIWTQIAPWWWCLVGVATVSEVKSDLIFKGEAI